MKYMNLEMKGSISVEELLKTAQPPKEESECEDHAPNVCSGEHVPE